MACVPADIAIERNYDYYFWGHSDVAVMGKNSSASFGRDVVACAESLMATHPDWGIVYFAYDWFSAIRTDLVRKVCTPFHLTRPMPVLECLIQSKALSFDGSVCVCVYRCSMTPSSQCTCPTATFTRECVQLATRPLTIQM